MQSGKSGINSETDLSEESDMINVDSFTFIGDWKEWMQ